MKRSPSNSPATPVASLAAVLIAAVMLTLTACRHTPVYSHYEAIGHGGWDSRRALHFTVADTCIAAPYSAELGLRANGLFPFTQLSVVVTQQARPSGASRTDTLTIDITDASGNILGDGNSIYTYITPLTPLPHLAASDTLVVTVGHNMRRQVLEGLVDVGITVRNR